MAEPEGRGRERDLVLGPTEYAMILDETKGHVAVYVGPHKTSLSNTDRPVIFDPKVGSFSRCDLAEAIKVFPTADEGSYIVLTNPTDGGKDTYPKSGAANSLPALQLGRKVNIPGPISFPLYPSQVATVIGGHRLRSNQYLVVRVYNDEMARKHWEAAVIKPQAITQTPKTAGEEEPLTTSVKSTEGERPELTMGQLLVVKGTDVSFYIPSTGVEVVPGEDGEYARSAVTLEQLEYCILLNESGKTRYVRGPAVVFPEPTETFVKRDNRRKFRAIELNENMGLYLKVIADYEEGDRHHRTGEELFITGAEQKIYFPREEHAIIRYGENEVHYAVAIPDGEARHVLNKLTGEVQLIKGPKMFLADPRTQVLVRRVLDSKTVGLWFPDNKEALDYNIQLSAATRGSAERFVQEGEVTHLFGQVGAIAALHSQTEAAKEGFAGTGFERKQTFTSPREVTLDTKYDGAVAINVWTGYAIQVVSKTDDRRVVVGPATVLLEYDETLEVLEMSTGTPKNDDHSIRTVYLRVKNNKVSDMVTAETKDLVQVTVKVSYRVNFEGDEGKWFGVENYVKLLTDHLRSMVRNAIKQHGIENFINNAITIIRDTVLGNTTAGENEGGKRPGRPFEENGMRVYDVEILDVKIGDGEISKILTGAQHESVRQALKVAEAERNLAVTTRLEDFSRKTEEAKAETERRKLELQVERIAKELALELERIAKDAKTQEEKLKAEDAKVTRDSKIAEKRRAISKADADQEQAIAIDQQKLGLEKLKAEVESVVQRAQAFGPGVIEALQAFANKDLAGKVAESMAPLAILGGDSVATIMNRMLSGTVLENVFNRLQGNGKVDEEALTRR